MIPRRRFLRAAGVGLALPLLDLYVPRSACAAESAPPRRLVTICTGLGVHSPYLHPNDYGTNWEPSPYLKLIDQHRQDFSLLDGISHPGQTGVDGHASWMTWLTTAQHPGLPGFQNSISIDQLLATRIGLETRFASLQLSTDGSSQSHTSSGIMIPGEQSPARMFAKLFLDGTLEERQEQLQRLLEGKSVLDMLQAETKALARKLGKDDRDKLKEYYESIREMERRLTVAEAWINRPKPKVDFEKPQDVSDAKDLIGQMELLFELVPLALQTDSTRLITIHIPGGNSVPPIPGVSIDHHNLSHHGQDEEKIKQLRLIEEAEFRALDKLLQAMKAKTEAGATLLSSTAILFGSNLGNANSHDTKNLPIILAGGRFKHGQHIKLDRQHNIPLANLFVQIAHQMDQPIERFGSSTSTSVPGLVG